MIYILCQLKQKIILKLNGVLKKFRCPIGKERFKSALKNGTKVPIRERIAGKLKICFIQ